MKKSKRELKWGETPWDDLSKDELLRECQKMFAALQAAGSVLTQTRMGQLWHRLPSGIDQDSIGDELDRLAAADGYWGRGTGGRAYEMLKQATSRAATVESENLYRVFFRYAVDLLFQEPDGLAIGFGWDVCPVCGTMVGRGADGKRETGKPCRFGDDKCAGILRPLEWEDLKAE